MSLLKIRSEWARLAAGAAAPAQERSQVLVAATFTADPLVPYLGFRLHEETGDLPSVSVGPYDQLFQICLEPDRHVANTPRSSIVLLWRIEDFLNGELTAFLRGEPGALSAAKARLDEFAAVLTRLRSTFAGTVLVAAPPLPHGPDYDVRRMDHLARGGSFHRQLVEHWIAATDAIGNVGLLDMSAPQSLIGIENAYDARKWYMFRQPFSERFWSELGDCAALRLARERVAPKKCLVLDCDNTLWGGIIGEDGLDGIALGDDFPGRSFRDLQRQAMTLRSQGVLLALCSKNNEADVWEVFDRHDGMILKREHISAFRINWQPKADNLLEIARDLNIGADSLVFVDDSAIEIAQVQAMAPMVTCLHLSEDVARLTEALSAYRGFDRAAVSDEDRTRADMVSQERMRRDVAATMSPEEFRRSLDLVVTVTETRPEDVARVTQLTNKTNQFNLTTRRKTAAEITALASSEGAKVLAVRVSDRFGDYGLVGVAIVERDGDTARIESFLMSCRVLGRGVEEEMMKAVAQVASGWGSHRLRGEYVRSSKNQMVADFYARFGFQEVSDGVWHRENASAPAAANEPLRAAS